MNGKITAIHRIRLSAALALTMALISINVAADFGNLEQALAVQQNKSSFQLMLEQVQARARQRASAAPASAAATTPSVEKIPLGDETETVRLTPLPVVAPDVFEIEPSSLQRLRAEQAYERDQRRILDYRQQTRALTRDLRKAGPVGTDRYATRRSELVRFDTQNKRLSVQRKLRY